MLSIKRILFGVTLGLILLGAIGQSVVMAKDWNIYIMGVDVFDLKGRSPAKVGAGVAASYLVHEAGHMAIAGLPDRVTGVPPVLHYDSMAQGTGSAGFAAQVLVGVALALVNNHSDFNTGFHAFTAINAGMYPLRSDGDIVEMNNDGLPGEFIAGGTSAIGILLHTINRR